MLMFLLLGSGANWTAPRLDPPIAVSDITTADVKLFADKARLHNVLSLATELLRDHTDAGDTFFPRGFRLAVQPRVAVLWAVARTTTGKWPVCAVPSTPPTTPPPPTPPHVTVVTGMFLMTPWPPSPPPDAVGLDSRDKRGGRDRPR